MLAISLNVSRTDFWDMTPYEFDLVKSGIYKAKKNEVEEYQIKFKNQQDLSIINAWLTANWTRAKRMPNLDKVLGNKEKKEMTDDQMLAKVQALNAMWKGEVITNGKE